MTMRASRCILQEISGIVYWCMCDEEGSTYHTHLYVAFENAKEFSMMQRRFMARTLKPPEVRTAKTGIISAKKANGEKATNPRRISRKRLKNPVNCRRNLTAVSRRRKRFLQWSKTVHPMPKLCGSVQARCCICLVLSKPGRHFWKKSTARIFASWKLYISGVKQALARHAALWKSTDMKTSSV